jgi:hypothetical protein
MGVQSGSPMNAASTRSAARYLTAPALALAVSVAVYARKSDAATTRCHLRQP